MNAPQKTSACAPQSRVSDGVHLDKQETGAQSVISELAYGTLRDGDLLIVLLGGHEVRARVEHAPIEIEDDCHVELGYGADFCVRAKGGLLRQGPFDVGESLPLPRTAIMRVVRLREFRDVLAGNFEITDLIYNALTFMAAAQSDSDFKCNATYAAEKPWKHMQEAWLGGAEGLEAERA